MLVERNNDSRRPKQFSAGLFIAIALILAFVLFQQASRVNELPEGGSVGTDGHGYGLQEQESFAPYTDIEKSHVPDDEWSKDQDKDVSALLTPEQHADMLENLKIEYHPIYSKMTKDGTYVKVDFLSRGAYNPNIIPHPYKKETWIIVANPEKSDATLHDYWAYQLVCEAQFVGNKLRCTKQPLNLPIASTTSPHCSGDIDWYNGVIGPHDARIYHGLDRPYVTYVSQSAYNCVGQWMQDLRRIVDWDTKPMRNKTSPFFFPTNLQRPPPYGPIEKNWFPFWDTSGEMYLHIDISPTRVFARLHPDGSVGEDIAPAAASNDKQCMERYMPRTRPNDLEYIHQSTNSLLLTLCNRGDPSCEQTGSNTFLFTIFQHKSFYWHGQYAPYVMLFSQTAPFQVHGISSKPFWINGRGRSYSGWAGNTTKPKDQTEMVFITSMSWKQQGMTYHGYLDDDLFICFGIEDKRAGCIDVMAGDLVKYLNLCSDEQ